MGTRRSKTTPNSPDLNVLDLHTWDYVDQIVQKSDNKALPDLKREVIRAFNQVNTEEVRKAIKSWKKLLSKAKQTKAFQ